MPDRVGQVDHLALEDRSQSPVPPPVVGHEPHQGAEAYAARMAISGFRVAVTDQSSNSYSSSSVIGVPCSPTSGIVGFSFRLSTTSPGLTSIRRKPSAS